MDFVCLRERREGRRHGARIVTRMKSFLIPILTAVLSVSALAQPATPPDTVSVTGSGRVSVAPDRFSFNATVQTIAPTVEEAVNENNTKVAAVIAALKNA